MNDLYSLLVNLHELNAGAFRAAIAGVLVSGVCGVMGCFIILRRTSFLADAVAHSMLAGVVAGFLVIRFAMQVPAVATLIDATLGETARSTAMLIGATLAGLLTVALVNFISRTSRVKEDAVIGLTYTAVFSLGGVFASYFSRYIDLDLYHFLIGDLLGVSHGDMWMIAGVAAIVLAVVLCFFRSLLLVSFDPVMAASIGVSVLLVEYVLTICTAMVVVAGVTVVGVVMVVGLLIIPAATAYLISDRLSRMLPLAGMFGVTGFVIGYSAALWLQQVAPGAAIVLACAGQFSIAFCLAPKYGLLADWMRRRNLAPQQLVEDVLGSILRSPQEQAPLADVLRLVAGKSREIRRAVRSLDRQGLLSSDGETLSLTDEGRREGLRLLRAHRLWESYLAHVGMPSEELHDRAHQLEHVHDEETVDYLDDKLGHPLLDPHGSEIPEDFVHLTPGAEVNAALLRTGRRGEITALEPAAEGLGLEIGMWIMAGDRQRDGEAWLFHLPGGAKVLLDHAAADAVRVRVE
ncbi:metal ABC transporter permease [Lignipirellula cremea]|uniref:Manganese transport system membrane protein MntB n=1 Tax=Lignipirellula cremea TaxID=2528010 RepID=A0A518DLN4_9BACT|nr:iron chelate uptake ABC transporter family permease subunit [Lignipirellula cremea]QDU92735.1 Manganese transport system membrane protein MntB [Lignipirellula cremea]